MFKTIKRGIEDRVTQAVTRLTMHHDFFGCGVVERKRVFTSEVDTFATDGKQILINPDFAESLETDQIAWTLAHEVMHIFLKHHTRRGEREHLLWNVACDFAINQMLEETSLKRVEKVLIPGITKIPGVDTALFKGLDAVSIYNLLIDARKNQPQGQQGDQQGDQQGNQQSGQQGDQQGDQQADGDGGADDWLPDDVKEAAKHGEVQDAKGNKEEAEAEASMSLDNAARYAKKRGNMPSWAEGLVEKMIRPRISLYDHLETFMSVSVANDYSWARPNRRHLARRVYLPSATVEGGGHIVVGIDTSGSMSHTSLSQGLGVLANVAEDCQVSSITVIPCDARVNPESVKRYEAGEDISSFEFSGRGGTSFKPVFDYVREKQIECDQMVFFTDLECSFPDEPNYPVLWVTHKHAADAPWGKTVRV